MRTGRISLIYLTTRMRACQASIHVMTHRRSSTLVFSRTSSLTETFSSAGKNGSPAVTVFRTVTWQP